MDLSFGLDTLEEIFKKLGSKEELCIANFFNALYSELKNNNHKTLEEILRKDEDSYNYYKNRLAFKCGYQIVEWGNRYFPKTSPEEIFYLFLEYHKYNRFESSKINKPPVLKRIKGHLRYKEQGVK